MTNRMLPFICDIDIFISFFPTPLSFLTSISPYIGVIPTSTPLFSVGTYGSTPATAWQGNNIVFDTQGGGYIYPTVGAFDLVSHLITQSAAKSVVMSGISLTADSIPVTMEETGYILDKVRNKKGDTKRPVVI